MCDKNVVKSTSVLFLSQLVEGFFGGLPLGFVQHRVHANPPPKAHTQKPNGGGYA